MARVATPTIAVFKVVPSGDGRMHRVACHLAFGPRGGAEEQAFPLVGDAGDA